MLAGVRDAGCGLPAVAPGAKAGVRLERPSGEALRAGTRGIRAPQETLDEQEDNQQKHSC